MRSPTARQKWKSATYRLEDEGGQDVEEVLVRDREAAVDRVHPRERGAASRAVVPVLEHLTHEDVGVVVALLRAALELAGAMEERRDARDAERAEERQLERAGGVEREIDARGEEDDALMILHRVERRDLAEDAGGEHGYLVLRIGEPKGCPEG
jgi:hypothetical protein